MRAAQAVAVSGDKLAKADELITAKFEKPTGLSLTGIKALNLMLATAAGDAWIDKTHKITRGQLRTIKHLTNKEIEDILDELSAVRFKIEGISSRGRQILRRRPLFRFIDEEINNSDDDSIEFEFDEIIRNVLSKSDHYTILYKQTMLSFDSKYAIRLYEIGARQVRIGHRLEVTIQDLRELFGVEEGKIKAWNDFRRFVLDLAFKELNQVADFFGSWEVLKRHGRTVQMVSLAFAPKEPEAIEQARRDRAAHRSVRRVRRKGIEKIAD